MEIKDRHNPLREDLFWLNCLGFVVLLFLTGACGPFIRQIELDFPLDRLSHHTVIAWVLAINPTFFSIPLAILLAGFVGIQYAVQSAERRRTIRVLFLAVEATAGIMYLGMLWGLIGHIH